MRIAIVGAGISGLVTAHLLHRTHDVTVFEANAYPGGHANTVRVDTPNETHQVDTGFIVFNDRNYPNFERLLDCLAVRRQRSTMSFSVSDAVGDFEYSSASPNGLFANRAHLVAPRFHRMLADLARFNRAARELLGGRADELSLGDWLERHRFSRAFIERLIVPQASAVWSADPHQMWSFPARFLVEFFDRHGMLSFRGRPRWQAIAGGSALHLPGHDWWTYLVTTAVGGQVHYDPTPLVKYRVHPGNIMGSNAGLTNHARRLHMVARGRFRQWIDLNVAALKPLRGRMTAGMPSRRLR